MLTQYGALHLFFSGLESPVSCKARLAEGGYIGQRIEITPDFLNSIRKRFNLRGTASHSEMVGGARPILKFDRNNGLLQALKNGKSAAFSIP